MSWWFKIISLDLLLGIDEVSAEVMLVATIHVVGGGPRTCKRGHVICSTSFCISLFLSSVFLFFLLNFFVKMSCCLICNKEILICSQLLFQTLF